MMTKFDPEKIAQDLFSEMFNLRHRFQSCSFTASTESLQIRADHTELAIDISAGVLRLRLKEFDGSPAATPKVLSLFSGGGGMDLGLIESGIMPMAFVDSDPACRETIRMNHPNAIVFDDVFDNSVTDFAKRTHINVIVGGPPCQPFSTAGHQRFLSDNRSACLIRFFDIVTEIRPYIFVLENVPGIMQNKELISWMQEEAIKNGYSVSWGIFDAADFGTPQNRKRFLLVGCLGADEIVMPSPASTTRKTTVRDAIEDLEDNPGECVGLPLYMQPLLRKIPEGGCWNSSNLSKKDRIKILGSALLSSGGRRGYGRRLEYDGRAPTIMTAPNFKQTLLAHPTRDRLLSYRECKRLQDFPDFWKLSGSLRSKYRQIGNAVPVCLARGIGRAIVTMIGSVNSLFLNRKWLRNRVFNVLDSLSQLVPICLVVGKDMLEIKCGGRVSGLHRNDSSAKSINPRSIEEDVVSILLKNRRGLNLKSIARHLKVMKKMEIMPVLQHLVDADMLKRVGSLFRHANVVVKRGRPPRT